MGTYINMKIYFYDDYLFLAPRAERISIPEDYCYTPLDAAQGPTQNMITLTDLSVDHDRKWLVVTNSLLALDHRFGWNEEENHTDIYLWVDEKRDFVRIDKLTEKEIHKSHNICKMYLNGAFEYEERR